jgi:uncharacterized protein YkwD
VWGNITVKTMLSIVCCLVLVVGLGVQQMGQTRAQGVSSDPAIVQDMFNRMNALRARVGLPAYAYNTALEAAAYEHASYMVINQWWGHERPDGSRASDRAAAAGYVNAVRCCGENYYMSVDATPDSVFRWFVNSRPHYQNLVNAWYTEVGVGFSTDGFRKGYVLVFGYRADVVAPPAAPITTSDGSGVWHTVARGETLRMIAQRYGVTIEMIARANNIANPNRIRAGQRLIIPNGQAPAPAAPVEVAAPTAVPVVINPEATTAPPAANPAPVVTGGATHTVQRGENLFRIALRYGVTVAALAAANGISDPTRIYVGQVLTIPSR